MNAYVLDTSVAVGWYLDEAFSPSGGMADVYRSLREGWEATGRLK
jgi:hypothetical protein